MSRIWKLKELILGSYDIVFDVLPASTQSRPSPDPTQPHPWPMTLGDYPNERSTEKGFSEKWSVPQEPPEQTEEPPMMESERGMSPTMSLVIGIIIGSFTAMILIVIIVLKVRTGVDVSEMKQVCYNSRMKTSSIVNEEKLSYI